MTSDRGVPGGVMGVIDGDSEAVPEVAKTCGVTSFICRFYGWLACSVGLGCVTAFTNLRAC